MNAILEESLLNFSGFKEIFVLVLNWKFCVLYSSKANSAQSFWSGFQKNGNFNKLTQLYLWIKILRGKTLSIKDNNGSFQKPNFQQYNIFGTSHLIRFLKNLNFTLNICSTLTIHLMQSRQPICAAACRGAMPSPARAVRSPPALVTRCCSTLRWPS